MKALSDLFSLPVILALALFIAAGLLIGLPLAGGAMRGASTLLFGLSPTDVTTMVGATVVLAVSAALAGSVPAWRAARVDPAIALRSD